MTVITRNDNESRQTDRASEFKQLEVQLRNVKLQASDHTLLSQRRRGRNQCVMTIQKFPATYLRGLGVQTFEAVE